MFKTFTLADFLALVNAGSAEIPRPVHSTHAASIYDVAKAGKLRIFKCDVFKEELCYLFVGRPAYKWPGGEGEASWWQCPVVFVLRGLEGLPVKRIYPFDSGSFAKKRLPEYITMFKLVEYDLGKDVSQIGRVIHTFYGDTTRYLEGRGLSKEKIEEEARLGPRHARAEALIRLYADRSSPVFDDRTRTIEVQVADSIDIANGKLLGVIMPEEFRGDKELEEYFNSLNCIIKYYPVWPLRVDNYFSAIYSHVREIAKFTGGV